MACMSPFRIDIFFIGMLMCALLCEHDITCALRWGVTIVGVIFTRHCSPRRKTPFQVQVMCRWLPSSGIACVKKADCGFDFIL